MRTVNANRIFLVILAVLILLLTQIRTSTTVAVELSPFSYDIGNPSITDLWVDPGEGSDARTGATRDASLATVREAWNRIPRGIELSRTGYRIMLVPGTYQEESVPRYWESRYGTYQYPVIIQAADGPGTAKMPSLNIFDARFLYIIGLHVEAAGGDILHCERCDHLLIRQTIVVGTGDISAYRSPQEGIKINQSKYIYIEDSDVSGASDNSIDFVAVQYGHIFRNRIHHSVDWCVYLKGGSAYFRVEANEIYDCGTGGFSAGQGTGFEFMVPPWIHYEAYDIKFVNNLIHDTSGAGMGVNGGYNILLAHNTLHRVGKRSHVLEFAFGIRSCDVDTERCSELLNVNGWGTAKIGVEELIPNRNVYVYNNIVYNPSGYHIESQHFAIYGARESSQGSNIPSPARTDVNLQIRGNIIWNGPSDHPLGIEENDQGCQGGNPTCNLSQLRSENAINTIRPSLVAPERGNFKLSNKPAAQTYSIPKFGWEDAPRRPSAPAGNLDNSVPIDHDGKPRGNEWPGAYGIGESEETTLTQRRETQAPSETTPPSGYETLDSTVVLAATTFVAVILAVTLKRRSAKPKEIEGKRKTPLRPDSALTPLQYLIS